MKKSAERKADAQWSGHAGVEAFAQRNETLSSAEVVAYGDCSKATTAWVIGQESASGAVCRHEMQRPWSFSKALGLERAEEFSHLVCRKRL